MVVHKANARYELFITLVHTSKFSHMIKPKGKKKPTYNLVNYPFGCKNDESKKIAS